MDKKNGYSKIKETSDIVKEWWSRLENLINKTALSLEDDLIGSFPIDENTISILTGIRAWLNIWTRITNLNNEIWSETIPASLKGQLKLAQDQMTAQETIMTNNTNPGTGRVTNAWLYNAAKNRYNEEKTKADRLERDIQKKLDEVERLKDFHTGWMYETMTIARRDEIDSIITNAGVFNTTNTINNINYELWVTPPSTIDLDATFNGTAAPKEYEFYDEKLKKRIKPSDPLTVTATTMSGKDIQVTIRGIDIGGTPTQLSINNIRIEWDMSDAPLRIRDLSIRAINQDSHGRVFYHDKKLSLSISGGRSNLDLTWRNTEFWAIETNLDRDFLEQRLRQEYETNFNRLQREAFEKVLSTNPAFTKLNQTQKDRLYERMQDLGGLSNPVNIRFGNDPTNPTLASAQNYAVNDIVFNPGDHHYSLMPNEEDYESFRVWLINQWPKDILTDMDKYRDRLRNGLVANLENGETHYVSYFNDILKQFTDDTNVKTLLNRTLLDFVNDTNTADHRGFAADLVANLNATTPETNYIKKRYQRPMRWKEGEAQNYLSFFQGQSQDFKAESITAGWQTFSYSGKLDIHGAQSMSLSLKMKGGNEQTYTGWNPVSLVQTLLDRPEINPPHARFHAGLSVVKSVTKLARDNGISMHTAMTDEMMDALPMHIRNFISTHDNPMVEIEEIGGKIVARAYNLNLVTRERENEYKLFDESDFTASQSVRDLRQWVEWLLAVTNQTMNNVYRQYNQARYRSWLRPALAKKRKYGGLRNLWKTLSFDGESVSVWGKSFTLDCKKWVFSFSWGGLKKPIEGRNLGDLLAYNPALRGIELKALHVANEKMMAMYQDKLNKQNRSFNYGVLDEANHRVYILDKNGNLWYTETNNQEFESRWRQYTSGHRYGRIADDNMPTGFRVMKRGNTVTDKESYDNFLRNEMLVGSMVRSMSRTHRALATWAPW